jgi:hypothetical protein
MKLNLKSIIKSIANGLVKATPIVGNIKEELEKSRSEDLAHSPKGKPDYAKMFGYAIMGIIVVAVIFGKIDVETAKELIKKLNLFSFFS